MSILHGHTQGEGGFHTVALLPATFIITFFMNTFEMIETKIGRERELEADGLAGKICGKENMASALVKVHAFSNVWPHIENKMLESMSQGKQLVNASLFFEQIAMNLPLDFVSQGLGESHTEHPTDSHPSLNTRLNALGIPLNKEIITKVTFKIHDSASSYIDNIDEIEQVLTDLENRKLSHTHGVNVPTREDVSFDLILLRSMLSLVLSDGKISDDESKSVKEIYKAFLKKELSDE